MLSGGSRGRFGHDGLPDETIQLLHRTAGLSLALSCRAGVGLELTGDATIMSARALSRPHRRAPAEEYRPRADENIIVGTPCCTAPSGARPISEGVAVERFAGAIRRSAVVEGTGDHARIYDRGGVAVTRRDGRNFAGRMSGGIAYVYDPDAISRSSANRDMVDLENIGPAAAGSERPRHAAQKSVSVYDSGMGDPLRFDAGRLRILGTNRHLLQPKLAAPQWLLIMGKFR